MEQRKEAFRGVIWPREVLADSQGKSVHRYVIVGMLVTEKPIEGLAPNETVIDSMVSFFGDETGIGPALSKAQKFEAAFPLGDASNVLLSLNDIVGKPLRKKRVKKST